MSLWVSLQALDGGFHAAQGPCVLAAKAQLRGQPGSTALRAQTGRLAPPPAAQGDPAAVSGSPAPGFLWLSFSQPLSQLVTSSPRTHAVSSSLLGSQQPLPGLGLNLTRLTLPRPSSLSLPGSPPGCTQSSAHGHPSHGLCVCPHPRACHYSGAPSLPGPRQLRLGKSRTLTVLSLALAV